jgi:23S rRNA (cytidine1920-2'-O)/16S rRNA (cytidine1409-2'-O)-methyltransferase
MPAARRSPVVTLMTLLHRQFPGLDDPARLIKEGAVLVDGVPAISPRTRVRADAAIRIRQPRPLRGTIKLAHALAAFGIDVGGAVALDLGAAAGGFTQALLDAGAARVYAVDAGTGQLRGSLRADPRVINLERTNLARLGPDLISEPVDLITMDLSYLAIADAIGQVDRRLLASDAQLIALVKPTFELHAATLADQPQQVAAAVRTAARALRNHGWHVLGQQLSPIRGARGAIEMLLHARQRPAGPPARSQPPAASHPGRPLEASHPQPATRSQPAATRPDA